VSSAAAAGFGGLLTTHVEHVDLGRVGLRALRARVQRRQLHLAVGDGAGVRITLGRMRPVAVEVTEPGRAYEVAVPSVPNPWLAAAQRTALLWLASLTITWWLRRRRARAPHATLT
jgi:hypothetical protein